MTRRAVIEVDEASLSIHLDVQDSSAGQREDHFEKTIAFEFGMPPDFMDLVRRQVPLLHLSIVVGEEDRGRVLE
jgi:hypothetical protein